MLEFANKRRGLHLLAILFTMLLSSGALKAVNVLALTPASVNLTCSTLTGPGASATVTVKPISALSGNATIAVAVGSLSGGVVVTPPNATTLNASNSTAGIVYTISLAAGCAGVSTGAPTFRFTSNSSASPGVQNDATETVNTVLTSTTTPLVATPTTLTVTCVNTLGSYAPGPSQQVGITSAATGGTPFTIDTSGTANWITVGAASAAAASATPSTFSVTAASGCGGFAVNTSNTTSIHLTNSPAADKVILVTLQVLPPSPLVATPTSLSFSCVRGSGIAGRADVVITASSGAPVFSVDTASLPIWLTVDTTSAPTPKSVRFQSTSVCDSMTPGAYTTTARFKVTGYGDLQVSVSLLVTNKASKLSVSEGVTRNLNWTLGAAIPTATITAVSSDTPIPFTVTTGGALQPSVPSTQSSGLAYSFGTPINVSFGTAPFSSAQAGQVLSGTVTLAYGTPSTSVVVTFNITVQSPGATVSGLSPASIPVSNAGTVMTVVLQGSGFIVGDATTRTRVGIVSSGAIVTNTNIASNVINPSNIMLTITVPSTADAALPFSAGGTVSLGVCNPVNGVQCTVPTGTAVLTIGSNPIVQAVTSSSALTVVSNNAVLNISPYDMLSVFGSNFCSSGGTGCTSSQVLYGQPDLVSYAYPTSLSPDAASATQRKLTVTFQAHGSSTVLGTSPLMFATNSQINIIVPGALSSSIGSQVDMFVNFGYGTGATMKTSTPYVLNVTATSPGIFTVGSNGQGDGAVLDSNWRLVSGTSPGGVRTTGTDSDTIQIFMTGLGVPDSTASANTTSSAAWHADCLSNATYLTWFNALTGNTAANLDGTLLLPGVLAPGRLVPCIKSDSADVPTVTIGGQSATVSYAGWVPGTVAGLYQVNVQLPANSGPFTNAAGATVNSGGALTVPVQVPVSITANSRTSQPGVTMWIAPKLKVVAPSINSGRVGIAWLTTSNNNRVVASQGTGIYRYAITSGTLPAGLIFSTSNGGITGTPAANTGGTYAITVTATDSANVPVTGSVSFTLTVAADLFTSITAGPYTATYGTPVSSIATVTPSGGIYPYTYTIATSVGTIPSGIVVSTSGVVSVGVATNVPAGTYHVTVSIADSTAGTPLQGSVTFDIVVALALSNTTINNTISNGSAGNVTTVSATGNTGTVSYALSGTPPSWVTINSSTGVLAVSSSSTAGPQTVTVVATDGTTPSNATAAGTGTTSISFTIQ